MTYLLIAVAYFIIGLAVIGLFLWWSDRRGMLSLIGFALCWPATLVMLITMLLYDLLNEDSNHKGKDCTTCEEECALRGDR